MSSLYKHKTTHYCKTILHKGRLKKVPSDRYQIQHSCIYMVQPIQQTKRNNKKEQYNAPLDIGFQKVMSQQSHSIPILVDGRYRSLC